MNRKQNYDKVHSVNTVIALEHQNILNKLSSYDCDKFGGMYFTDHGSQLHIAILDGNDSLMDAVSEKNVLFHRVRYSWALMNEAQSAIDTLIGRYGIHLSRFEPENNVITMGVRNKDHDIIQSINKEMRGLGYDLSMFRIAEEDPAEGFGLPTSEAEEEHVHDKTSVLSAYEEDDLDDTTTIMPGGMIQVLDSTGAYKHICSVNYAFVYNSIPYLVGAGHTGSEGYIGRDAYYIPPNDGYPISNVPTTYNSTNRVKVGTVALHRLGGNYDLRTIRVTENNLSFSHTAYNGKTISSLGGTIVQGAPVRVCGITSRYDADYEYGYCSNAQVSMSAYGKTMTNLFQLDFGANNGTSGGPVMTQDADGTFRLVGLASVNGTSTCYAMPIRFMINTYNLSGLSEGTISI